MIAYPRKKSFQSMSRLNRCRTLLMENLILVCSTLISSMFHLSKSPSTALSSINDATASPRNGEKLIDDHTLVALTIMIAESNPEEKEMIISVIMNCIK